MAPCLLPKTSGVEVTPSVTLVESPEQFWCKIRQIWGICEPCFGSENKMTEQSLKHFTRFTVKYCPKSARRQLNRQHLLLGVYYL